MRLYVVLYQRDPAESSLVESGECVTAFEKLNNPDFIRKALQRVLEENDTARAGVLCLEVPDEDVLAVLHGSIKDSVPACAVKISSREQEAFNGS